jgi:hypothetical protein
MKSNQKDLAGNIHKNEKEKQWNQSFHERLKFD